MLKDFDFTSESILRTNDGYRNTGSKLIVRDTRVQALNKAPEQVLMTKTERSKKSFNCGRKGTLQMNDGSESWEVVKTMTRGLGGRHLRVSDAPIRVILLRTARATRTMRMMISQLQRCSFLLYYRGEHGKK